MTGRQLQQLRRAGRRHAWTAVRPNAVGIELGYVVLASDEDDGTRTLQELDITGLTLTPTSEASELIREADAASLRELRRESDRIRIEMATAGIDRTPNRSRTSRPTTSCANKPRRSGSTLARLSAESA